MCDVYTETLPGGRGRRSKVTVWNCCYCGAGAMLCATTPACTTCGHQRCAGGGGGGGDWTFRTTEQSRRQVNVPAESNPTTEPVPKVPSASSSSQNISIKEQSKRKVDVPTRPNSTAKPVSKAHGAGGGGRIDSIKEQYITHVKAAKASNTKAEPVSKVPDQQRASSRPRDLMRDLLEVKDVSKHRDNLAGTANTDVSDADTVISSASSAVTLVDPGAVEAFVRNVMRFQSLGCLWPQLVGRCDTKERCIHVIERLLKRYSKDLTLVSLEMQGSKTSDSRLCHAAARFVRKSRLQIARKIWEAQVLSSDHSKGKDSIERLSEIEVPNLEVDDDDDGPTDDDLLFERIEEILFDKGPIFSLQANIKLLVNISTSTYNGIVYRISTSLSTSIRNAISSLYEPPLSTGHTRLRYTCVSFKDPILYLYLIFLVDSEDTFLLPLEAMLIILRLTEEMRP